MSTKLAAPVAMRCRHCGLDAGAFDSHPTSAACVEALRAESQRLRQRAEARAKDPDADLTWTTEHGATVWRIRTPHPAGG